MQGAKPEPWAILFTTSNTAMAITKALMKSGPLSCPVIQWLRSAVHPNRMLMITLADRPMAKCQRALARSAIMPFKNFDTP